MVKKKLFTFIPLKYLMIILKNQKHEMYNFLSPLQSYDMMLIYSIYNFKVSFNG